MNKKQELAKNTLILTVGKICTQCISFFLLPLYTALLAPEEYGVVDLFNTYIALLLPLVNWSFDYGLFRHLLDVRNEPDRQKKLFSTIINSNIFQSAGYLLLFATAYNFISSPYKIFLAISVVLNVFSSTLLQLARGLGDNTGYTFASVLSASVTIGANIFTIVVLHMGAWGLFIGTIFGQVSTILFLILKEKVWRYYKIFYFNRNDFRSVFKYSFPLVPAQLSWWVIGASDRTIVSFIISVAANGAYSVANKFSTLIVSFYNIFNMAWTESVSVHFNDKDRDEFLSETIDTVLILFYSVCIGLVACMPIVFPLMVDKNYIDAYPQIPILTLSVLFQVMTGLYSVIYIAIKKTKENAKTAIFAALINIVVNLVLIKFIGLYAASISTLLAYVAMTIYRHIDVKKYTKLKLKWDRILIASGIFVLVTIAYYININWISLVSILVAVIYAVIANISIIKTVLKRFPKHEKDIK